MLAAGAIAALACGAQTAVAVEGQTAPTEGQSTQTKGVDHAIQVITDSMNRQELHLTALLDKLPESARAGIERAIEANREGREKALAALSAKAAETQGNTMPKETAGADFSGGGTTPTSETASSGQTGLQRARGAILEAQTRVTQQLNGVMELVPSESQSRISQVIARIKSGTNKALAELGDRTTNRNIEGNETAAARAQRPPRTDRPDKPLRPDSPSHSHGGGI